MYRKPQTLPSRAWSGASMVDGINTMATVGKAIVKTELPENEKELVKMVEDMKAE